MLCRIKSCHVRKIHRIPDDMDAVYLRAVISKIHRMPDDMDANSFKVKVS